MLDDASASVKVASRRDDNYAFDVYHGASRFHVEVASKVIAVDGGQFYGMLEGEHKGTRLTGGGGVTLSFLS